MVDQTGQPYVYVAGDPVNGIDPSGAMQINSPIVEDDLEAVGYSPAQIASWPSYTTDDQVGGSVYTPVVEFETAILGRGVGGSEAFKVRAFSTLAIYALYEATSTSAYPTLSDYIRDVVLEPRTLGLTPTSGDVLDGLCNDDSLNEIKNKVHYAGTHISAEVEAADFVDDAGEWGLRVTIGYWIGEKITEDAYVMDGSPQGTCGNAFVASGNGPVGNLA